MGELLVIHGAWLWSLGVVAGVVVGFVVARWIRGRGERARALAEVATWTSRVSVPILARTEGEITVTGVLGGGSATTLTVDGAKRYHDRTSEIWVDYRGDVLDLAGAVRVVRGTTVVTAHKLPGATPRAIVARLPGRGHRHELASVRQGDSVIVHGSLSVTAGTQPVDRFGRRRWSLEPPPGKTEVELIATLPRTAPPALGWAAGVSLFLAFALASGLGLAGAGRLAISRAESRSSEPASRLVSPELGLTDPLALAAALPGSRDRALDLLDARYENEVQRTADSFEQRRKLGRLRGGCRAEAAVLRIQDRFDEMLAVAEACDDRASIADALLLLGRYEDAASRGGSAYPHRDGVAMIGAGRWLDAAKVAASLRELVAQPGADPMLTTPDNRAAIQPRLECAEQLFRLRGGERDARDRLHAMASRDPLCKLIDAIAQPPDKIVAGLAAARDAGDAYGPDIDALAWAAGGDVSLRDVRLFDTIALSTPFDHGARHEVLAPFALATRRDRPGSPGYLTTHVRSAAYAMLRGDVAGATREAALAGEKSVEAPQELGQAMATSIALRTGAMPPSPRDTGATRHPGIDEAVAVRVGVGPPKRRDTMRPAACSAAFDDALGVAIGGNGGPLAQLMTSCDLDWHSIDLLFAVLPRIERNRAELVARLPYLHSTLQRTAGDAPFAVIRDAALHRDLAKLAGDAQRAAWWQAILDRHLKALADRDRAFAMVVWALL